ncbi:hypothetical protein Cycma_3406 [Cyclobacterium marinum DSM 745]|uniref:Uncharacterized protein n=1 Tax=Cyclobacterium marinum (strain ATCC 25205 / DSM 745 / LMG 13164 / NCIMB 1802) TaxID=880070 RepID=G0IWE1_CYCMS|nr:hypothetical protein Cycma_3406 [Cyclobacterium marinum DSM 745]
MDDIIFALALIDQNRQLGIPSVKPRLIDRSRSKVMF